MDDAVQSVAKGTGNFFVTEWIPIILDPHTWIALLTSWAVVETLKQFNFMYKRDPGVRRDINRIMGFVCGFVFAYIAYRYYVKLPKPYIPAFILAVLSPWIYRIVTAIMDRYEFTRDILDAVKPHRRNKFVPLPKEHPDDPTTFTKVPDYEDRKP